MTLNRKQQGFTIVELLIVIVVIGILAALVITSFTGIQQKARDTERTTDVKALHSSVENYYALNGRYPTLANLQDDDFIQSDLRGLDVEAARDPKGQGTNDVEEAAAQNRYGYAVTAAGGDACDNATADCAEYTLTATLEGGGTFEKSNLN